MSKTTLSLFIDDTHFVPHGQFRAVVDFCLAQGVCGKVSLIAGLGGEPTKLAMGQAPSPEEWEFLDQLKRIAAGGMDIHMEMMTHAKLWDFGEQKMRSSGPCEGAWLYDPAVSQAEYQAYIGAILDHAARYGITINGISVPGCICDDCRKMWEVLAQRGQSQLSDTAIAAVLALATQGKWGVPAVAIYSDEADAENPTRVIARQDDLCVFDARLNLSVQDLIGFDGKHDSDYYISADGTCGKIPELVNAGAPHFLFCAHWFDMNPTKPAGWHAFQDIILRINSLLGDRIEWARPSDIGARLHAASRRTA